MSASTSKAATSSHGAAEPGGKPISVLFVCLGNICRSPMAHAVFASLTASNPLIGEVDSAGTAAYYHEGDPPDPRTLDVLRANGIDDFDHAARVVTESDLTHFDYIFAMDKSNLTDLQRRSSRQIQAQPSDEAKMGQIMMFGDFGGRKGEQVVDPYYGADNGFKKAYEQMVRFTNGFVAQVLEDGRNK